MSVENEFYTNIDHINNYCRILVIGGLTASSVAAFAKHYFAESEAINDTSDMIIATGLCLSQAGYMIGSAANKLENAHLDILSSLHRKQT